jgi:alkanesulfonate monooxygenase SsuD/methylene tetrahydromethanopterin reductase-like flavin-dependent oxidoreductase (luciferase family)
MGQPERMSISMNIRHHLGSSYESVRDVVWLVERLGFSGAYFPDHFLATRLSSPGSGDQRIVPRRDMTPSDCWTLIALLVPQTQRLRLGTLMSSATFRHPSVLAIAVAQLNRVSGGRIALGLGTNWLRAEHEAFGFAFPSQRERFDLLEDQLEVIKTLWPSAPSPAGEDWASSYELVDPPRIDAGPDGRHARLIVGGVGLVKTPRLAATFADEVNATTAGGLDRLPVFLEACDRACVSAGRDPSSLRRSVMLWVCCGADGKEIAVRAKAVGVEVDQLESAGVLPCTPPQLVDRIGELRSLGFDEVVLASRGPLDADEIELIGTEVVPSAPA